LDYENRKYKKRIALFMTAGSSRREWDKTHFKEVVENILCSKVCQFVLMGSGKEAEAKALDMKKRFPGEEVLNLTGKTTLRQTYAVLTLCDIYLGGDTGPMHMAVAAGLKGVVLSCHPITGSLNHDNSPARFGPWNHNQMTVLRPNPMPGCEDGCNHDEAHCINNIAVNDVCEELKQYLG
jgi:heptosyltransferase-2